MGSEHRIAFVSAWGALDECVRALPAALAVVDPHGQGGLEVEAVERLAARHPSLPIVLYLGFGPRVAKPLLRWGRGGVRDVVFLDLGDSRHYLRDVVRRALARSSADALADDLVAAMAPLPDRAAEILRTGLRRLTEIRTVSDWALSVGLSAAGLSRALRRAGLPSARRCLDWLRLLFVVHHLADPGCTLEDLHRRLAPGVAQGFWKRVPALTGVSASDLPYTVTVERLFEQFAAEGRAASIARPTASGAGRTGTAGRAGGIA